MNRRPSARRYLAAAIAVAAVAGAVFLQPSQSVVSVVPPARQAAAAGLAPTPAPAPAAAPAREYVKPMFDEINRVRRVRGLRVLRASAPLARAGTAHARVLGLTGTFTHDWPDGTPLELWIRRRFYGSAGYRSWMVGENLLWGSTKLSPKAAVAAWLKSRPHRVVLLGAHWRELGIGVVRIQNAPGMFVGHDISIAAAEFGTRRR